MKKILATILAAALGLGAWALTGDGTSASPYQIANASDLAAMRDMVNNGTADGKCWQLTADITLSGTWSPIGTTDTPFSGTFDGDGHTISGLVLSGPVEGTQLGLFGVISGTANNNYATIGDVWANGAFYEAKVAEANYTAVVKNLVLANVNVSNSSSSGSTRYTGALAGQVKNAYVANITVSGSVSGTKGVGGITGSLDGSVAKSCVNSATIVASGYNVGGIAGGANYCNSLVASAFIDCSNSGSVTTTAADGYAGGIVGMAQSGSGKCDIITGCSNSGTIHSVGASSGVGGIAGQGIAVKVISDCSNSGTITSEANVTCVGGIAGTSTSEVYDSSNYANITVSADYLCGIYTYDRNNAGVGGLINGCVNEGTLTNTSTNPSAQTHQLAANSNSAVYSNQVYADVAAVNAVIAAAAGQNSIEFKNCTVTDKSGTLILNSGLNSIISDAQLCTAVDVSTGNASSLTVDIPGVSVTATANYAGNLNILGANNTVTVNADVTVANLFVSGNGSTVTNDGTVTRLELGGTGAVAATNNGTLNKLGFGGTGTYTVDNNGTISHTQSAANASANEHTVSTIKAATITINNYGTIESKKNANDVSSYALLFYGGSTAVINCFDGSLISCEQSGRLLVCGSANSVTFNVQDGASFQNGASTAVPTSHDNVIVNVMAQIVNLGSVTLWVSGSDKWSFSLGFEYTKYDQEDPEEVEDYYNPVVADTTVATITTIDASAMFDGATALGKIHAVAAGETTIECQIADYDEDYNDILVPARFTVVVRAPDPDAPAVLGYSSVGGYTIGYATEDGDTVATLTAEAEAMGLTVVATGTYSEMTNLKDNHVAKIGNVPYLTLQAALEAATNGTTVELLSDVDEDIAQIPALQNVTLDFCGHTLTGQLKGYYSKKIDGLLIKNGTIVGRDSNNWANLQIASGSKNVVVENMTLTTVRNNGSRSGYAFYNQSGSSVALRNVVADGRFYVGNSGSIIAIESGTYRNTFNGAHAIQNNGVVAAKGGTFYYDPTTPDNLVADGYVAIETNDVDDVQCWVIERGPSLATITLADGTETEYWDINEAFGAIEEGCTLTIKPGEYTLAAGTGAAGAYNLPANVTIVGAGDNANDVRISSLNQTSPKGLILSGSGITISNIYFKAEQNEGSALVIRGSGTVVDCVLDGMNETYHCVSDGMYQGIVNGTLHFLRCSILAERYAINVGETSGEVIIEDCTVKGWSSFGSGVKVTVLNTTFAEGTVTEPDYSSPYNDIRFYDDAFISNCTFNAQMEVNVCYESRTGIKLIVDDSTYQGEGTLSSIITESATQSSASSSDIANNYVAVGTGVELDENGYITGGLFERVDDALIASECVTGSNSDGETSVTYPTAVGLLRVTDIEPQPGATEMKATYAVTAVVVNDEGEPIGIFASQQMIEVSIAAADVAGSTLAKYDVSKVLEAAFASAGEDALNVTKVEIGVVISAPSSGEGTISYEVHPEAVVTVTEDATDTTTTIPLSNACLAADASFTFDLDVTGVVAAGDWAKVTHVSADPNYAAEARNLKAFAGDGGKVYVTVPTTHFSTFTIGAGVPPVTFGVRSDNLFGSIKIAGNVASNLYVAVPFEGFEADGALRKAQDVVHAANLTAGTKMYVYDKNADKYDVFEVDANGKWAAALKINVTEMTNTFDTADLMRGVTNGTGVIVGRKNTAETVYVYGQVPKIPIASTTFGAGQTLVSPPYTNGVAYVDLNASTWTGVKATQQKRLKNQKGADYIQFRTAENRLVKYFYLEGEGWGVTPTQVSQCGELVANGKALIPVGTAFWYYSNAGGAKVEWK